MPARAGRTRRRLSREQREATFLDAAARILAEQGFEALTMERLAMRVGVNKALPYQHFANRDAVLVALWDREVRAFDRRVVDAIGDAASLDDKLRAMLDVWLDSVESGWTLLTLLDQPGFGPPELAQRRHARIERVVEFLADLIREEYPMTPRDALTAAAILGAGAQGLVELRERTGWPRARLTETFRVLCRGALEKLSTSRGRAARPRPR